ncbi:Rec8 like protein-domain-containing protein [Mycena floridula]|nr:Rec8 like protein-domain-containing protein [Mycena floridula]
METATPLDPGTCQSRLCLPRLRYPFYSDALLSKRGPLGKVWLAAHMERKLSKAQTMQTDIEESVVTIMEQDGEVMALRMIGQLLLGVVRIYSRKANICLTTVMRLCSRLNWCWRHDRGSACCKQECYYLARCKRCRYQHAYSRHGLGRGYGRRCITATGKSSSERLLFKPCTTLTPLVLAPRTLTRISTWVLTSVKETALVSMVVMVLDEIVEQARRAESMAPSAIGSDILGANVD